MTRYHLLRLLGLLLLIAWATALVMALSALAGIEAEQHGRPGPVWVTPSPHPGPPPR